MGFSMGKFTCSLFQTFFWCTNVIIEKVLGNTTEVPTVKSRFKSKVVVDYHDAFRDLSNVFK